jgi:hypothetical protein
MPGSRCLLEKEEFRSKSCLSPPVSITELPLKAYLRGAGSDVRSLKNQYGHDLGKLLQAAEVHGLAKLFPISSDTRKLISSASDYYIAKDFPYTTRGVPVFGELEPLFAIAHDLIQAVREHCLENMDYHTGKLIAVPRVASRYRNK